MTIAPYRHFKLSLLIIGFAMAFVVLLHGPLVSAETIQCADDSVHDVAESDSAHPEAVCVSNGGVKNGAIIQSSASAGCPKNRFLGMPPWYEYLKYEHVTPDLTHRCEVILDSTNILSNIWPIGLALLDMVLVVAGIASVGFVMYGGVRYVLSQGEPEHTKAAKETIINALIGGVIAMLATAIVSFIGHRLGG